VFLAQYGTLFDIGVYSVAYNIGYALIGVIFNPIWVMYPSAAAEMYNTNRIRELQQLFRYSTTAALALLVPAMAGLWLYARPLLALLTTPDFVQGADYAVLITIGYAALMMAGYYEISLGLVGKQSLATVSLAAAAVLHIGLNFLLIPAMGIGGAALSTLLSFAFQYALIWYLGSRVIPVTYDRARLWRICVATAAMVVILRFVHPREVESVGGLVLASALGIAVYATALILLRTITRAEVMAVVALIRAERTAPESTVGRETEETDRAIVR
jgi:O-antigen/teichoic acid export membrane protein